MLITFKRIILPAKRFSPAQIAVYERYGYRYVHLVPLGKTRQEPFLIRKQGRKSAVHTYVCEALRQYFWQHGVRPKRWISVGADLMLTQKYTQRKLAIEVETGNQYRIDKDHLLYKFRSLAKRFDVVIILTDSYYLARYKHLFPALTILLRKDALTYFSRRMKTLGFSSSPHKYYRRRNRARNLSRSTMMYYYNQEFGSTNQGLF